MKTARKTLQLLRQFSMAQPELGVSELARRLEMDRAGVHRLLRAMMEERFIEQDPQSRLYRLGLGVLDVAAVRISQHGLLAIATPHLDRLREEVGETVALLVADGLDAVCLAVVESRHPVRVGYDIGERFPLHSSAGGQALLAFLAESERQALYARGLKRFTPKTPIEPAELEAELAGIRESRLCWSSEGYIEGVVSAAAPVMDPKRGLAGAVSIAAPAARVEVRALPDLAAAARRVADAIEAEWAGFAVRSTAARIV
ncbi:MAG TPA: IclR family transcriptional regulator [Roseomonas sp.]|nr:IclR family transcriptional regulator [Roseomonas sp.]